MQDKTKDKLDSNQVNLFGQQFHSCVSATYIGVGIMLANGFHRWFPGATDWLPLIGIGMLFTGASGWLLLWRRQRKG